MIYLKTDEEIELMRVSNLLVGKTLGELSKWIAPGITTLKLDKIAEEFIRDNGGVPGFLGYAGYPALRLDQRDGCAWDSIKRYSEGGRHCVG